MEKLEISETINAPINNVWKLLADFGSLSKWSSLIVKSSVEGTGVGATRTCSINMPGLGEFDIQEILETIDEDAKILSYRPIDNSVLPTKNSIATWKLEGIGDNQTKINYIFTYESSEMSLDEVKAMIEPIVKETFKDLEKSAV